MNVVVESHNTLHISHSQSSLTGINFSRIQQIVKLLRLLKLQNIFE